ncbi:MAG: tetratricopeptide repeat protein [Anaerolineae bacterium]|nr:tetratricopeptide repeat protein [Anaerolineae bacterium]
MSTSKQTTDIPESVADLLDEATNKQDMIRRWFGSASRITMLLAVLAILVALFALFQAYRHETENSPEFIGNGPVTPDEARLILDRADDASNLAGNILSFLEVLLGVAGFLGAGLVWVIRSALEGAEKDVRELMKIVEERFRDREQHLAQLEKSLADDVAGMRAQMKQQMGDAQVDAQNAFRVLRLQLLAEQQVRAHNVDTAIDTLEQAYKAQPDDHATNYLLGYLYSSKDIDKAIEFLERALQLEPDFTPGIAALGLALRRKGDKITDEKRFDVRDRYWGEAEAKLRAALGKDSRLTDADGESYFGSLGGLYRRQQHYYAALDAYERAHEVTPDSSYPVINLASIHKRQGNDEQAAEYFERVVERAHLTLDDNPRDVWTRFDYAQALLVLDQPEEALRQIQIVLNQDSSPGVLETVLDGLRFLTEAPTPIDGLPEMIALLEKKLAALREQATPASGKD